MTTPRRVLLVIAQLPQDPASGAARSMLTICRMLQRAGFEVRALATTATERAGGEPAIEWLREQGHEIRFSGRPQGKLRGEIELIDEGVAFTLLDTGDAAPGRWDAASGRRFDRLFDAALRSFRPDAIFTYGDAPPDAARRRRAREAGCTVVFALHNLGYLHREALKHCDAFLVPSVFLRERYRAGIGIEATALPPPLDIDEVLAARRDPVFTTLINPSPEKGVVFAARLVEELSTRRPDVPVLVVEARGTAKTLTAAGLAGGFDLRRHENVMISPGVSAPREIFAVTRVLLVPSVGEEAAGRVVPEALVNGVPPLVSDRGGLPEMCGEGGFVLSIPAGITTFTEAPPGPEAVLPWVELVARMVDDEPFYSRSCAAAAAAGRAYRPDVLAPRLVAFFEESIGESGR